MQPFDSNVIEANYPTKKTKVTHANMNTKENREKGQKDNVKNNLEKDPVTKLWFGKGAKVKNTGDQLLDDTFYSLSNSQQITIWVPGMNMNYVGGKVDIALPGPRGSRQYQDEVFSGEYEIAKYRDFITAGGYYVQELLLRRPPPM
jgi:hypothetical protein